MSDRWPFVSANDATRPKRIHTHAFCSALPQVQRLRRATKPELREGPVCKECAKRSGRMEWGGDS